MTPTVYPVTSYPVARRGRLVRAFLKALDKDRRAKVLSFEEGERALLSIERDKGLFLAALRQAVEETAAKLGLAFRWCDDETILKGLSKAGRNRGLGAIYDFDEFAFELDGQLVVSRACVTLCTLTEEEQAAKQAQLPLSKFWIRFMLVRQTDKKGRTTQAVDVDVHSAVAFGARYREIGDVALERIVPVYRDILSEVLPAKILNAGTTLEIDAKDNGAFSVLALGTPSKDFANVFDATRAGRRLTEEAARDDADVAKQLVKLAFESIPADAKPRKKLDPKADLQTLLGERVKYIVYEGPTSTRGLFLGRFENNEVNFVGLTQSPQDGAAPTCEDISASLSTLHSYSANTVSGGLVQEYALAF